MSSTNLWTCPSPTRNRLRTSAISDIVEEKWVLQLLRLIHNEDDIIMLPGEVDSLRDMFGSRAQIYPRGGHCGNMSYPENVAGMVDFFQAFPKN